MPAAEAYLVEEMAPSGVEMVVGGYRHARFGPVLMAGFGGYSGGNSGRYRFPRLSD